MSASTIKLVKISFGVAASAWGVMYTVRSVTQTYIRQSPPYREALEHFRNNSEAKDALGEPIKEKAVNVGDKKCFGRRKDVVWVNVPLEGRKSNGYLRYWMIDDDPLRNTFRLFRVELEVDGSTENKLIFKDDAVEKMVSP